MDFSWSKEQLETQCSSRAFGKSLGIDIVNRDHSGRFSREDWDRLSDAGFQRALLSIDDGGKGWSLLDMVAALEGLGGSCPDAGLIFALGAQSFAFVAPLLAHGTDEQRAQVLPKLANGEHIGAFAMTEAETGSSALDLRSRAQREGDGYRLDGEKVFITNGPIADIALVLARTADGSVLNSLSAFLVDLNIAGVSRGKKEDMTGLRTTAIGSLQFDNVQLPISSLLGREGAGAWIFMNAMEWERIGILAASIGRMESQIDRCIEYARQRRLGGHAIKEHQAVSHRIANMRCQLEGARLQLYRAAWTKDQGQKVDRFSAQSKLAVSETAVDVATAAIRIHGGVGLRRELGLERELRDALMALVYSGTSDIQRNLIASGEGL